MKAFLAGRWILCLFVLGTEGLTVDKPPGTEASAAGPTHSRTLMKWVTNLAKKIHNPSDPNKKVFYVTVNSKQVFRGIRDEASGFAYNNLKKVYYDDWCTPLALADPSVSLSPEAAWANIARLKKLKSTNNLEAIKNMDCDGERKYVYPKKACGEKYYKQKVQGARAENHFSVYTDPLCNIYSKAMFKSKKSQCKKIKKEGWKPEDFQPKDSEIFLFNPSVGLYFDEDCNLYSKEPPISGAVQEKSLQLVVLSFNNASEDNETPNGLFAGRTGGVHLWTTHRENIDDDDTEGMMTACSFWNVQEMSMSGQRRKKTKVFSIEELETQQKDSQDMRPLVIPTRRDIRMKMETSPVRRLAREADPATGHALVGVKKTGVEVTAVLNRSEQNKTPEPLGNPADLGLPAVQGPRSRRNLGHGSASADAVHSDLKF